MTARLSDDIVPRASRAITSLELYHQTYSQEVDLIIIHRSLSSLLDFFDFAEVQLIFWPRLI